MRKCLLVATLAIFALSSASDSLLANWPAVGATCDISCTIAETVEWSQSGFQDVEPANLTGQNAQIYCSTSVMLYTNGDVTITADSSDLAQLAKDDDQRLVTEYKLEYNGGKTITGWSSYEHLLINSPTLMHITGDAGADVTLSANVHNHTTTQAEVDKHSATVTLTVCWQS
jgi:hypothetical protein